MATVEVHELPHGGPMPPQARMWRIDPRDTSVPLQVLLDFVQHMHRLRDEGMEPNPVYLTPRPAGSTGNLLGEYGYLGLGPYPKDKN